MKFSIIINTHNQSKFINDCIKSCKNQNFLDYEILIVDTSVRPLNVNQTKNLKYFHIKEKFKKYPVMNQMYQIEYGLKKSKGDFICLLDGDDKFERSKLKKMYDTIKNQKNILIQDVPIIFSKNRRENKKIKKYKNNLFFRKTFIEWPQVFGTSTISCNRKILELFFKKGKPFEWKYLAIDVKLILFVFFFYKIKSNLNEITLKRIHENNLDNNFSNLFSKYFWKRRKMQHDYRYFLTKKNFYNLDYCLTKFVNFFL